MADTTLSATLAKQLSALAVLMATGDGEALGAARNSLNDILGQQGLSPEQVKAVGETLMGNLLAGLERGDSPEQAAQEVASGARNLVQTVQQADAYAAQSLESALASGQDVGQLNAAAEKGGQTEAFQSALIQALQNGQPLSVALKQAKALQKAALAQEAESREQESREPVSDSRLLETMLAGMSEEQAALFLKAYQDAMAHGLDPRAALTQAGQVAEQHARIQAESHVEVPPAMRLAQALASGQDTQKVLREAGVSQGEGQSATADGFTKALVSGADPLQAAFVLQQVQSAFAHLESQQSVPISAADRLAMALANGAEAQNTLNALNPSGGQGNQAFLFALTQALSQGAPVTAAMQNAQSAGNASTALAQSASVPVSAADQLMAALAAGGSSATTAIAQASGGGGAEAFAHALNQALSQGGGDAASAVQAAQAAQAAATTLAAASTVPVSAEQQLIMAMADPSQATSESFKAQVSAGGDQALGAIVNAALGGGGEPVAAKTVAAVAAPGEVAQAPVGAESPPVVANAPAPAASAPAASAPAADKPPAAQTVASLASPVAYQPAPEPSLPQVVIALPPAVPETPVEKTVESQSEPPQPVNTAPFIILPDSQTADEDRVLNIVGIVLDDAEADSLTVSVRVGHGTLTLAQTEGLFFITGDGVGDAYVSFKGAISLIDAALNGVGYQGESDYNGYDTLEISTDDGGEYGIGGVMSAFNSLEIVVNAVNDAPTVSLAVASVAVDEDDSLVFAAGNGNGIEVDDLHDTGQGGSVDHLLTVVSVSHGTLSVTTGGGATVTANGSGSVTISGSAAGVNAALEGMVYAPTADYNGADTLVIVTHDEGYNGIGGTLTTSDAIAITVNPVNDGPTVATAVSNVAVDEDASLVFAAGNGNGMVVGDATDTGQAGSVDHLLTVVSVSHGTLSVTTGGGATVTANGSGSVTISGSAAGVNAALEGMVYAPTADYNGADTLVIVTHDEGYNGIGGTLMASDAIAITVNPVNDGPTVALLAVSSIAVDEDASLVFAAGNGNGMVVGDATDTGQAGSVDYLLTVVSVSHGTLSVTTGGGATVTANGSGSVTISGSAAGVNAALEGMVYAPTADYNGADTLVIVTRDEGYNGIGGTLMANDAMVITVNPVNDAPTVATAVASVAVDEDDSLVFAAGNGNGIDVGDLLDTHEAGSVDHLLTVVSVSHGTLSVTTGGGATVTANGSGSVTISGSAAGVNAALEGMIYAPTADYNGADTLVIVTHDEGYNGIGGTLMASDAIAITVNPVNDAPTVALAVASVAVDEDDSLVFAAGNGNGIEVGDLLDTHEAGSVDHLLTVVSVSHGTLSVTTGGGATVTANGSGSVTISGSAAGVNAALEGMVYAPTADYNGADTLVIVTHDEGYNGIGGTLMASDAIAVTVNPVNDAPTVATAVASVAVDEDDSLVFAAGNGNGIDVGDLLDTHEAGSVDHLLTVVSVSHGTLSVTTGGGATVTANGSGSVTISGSAAGVNAALEGMVYAPTADYNGADTLVIVTHDEGYNGIGGTLMASDAIAITVNPVNDAPTVALAVASVAVDEDDSLVFAAGNGNGIDVGDLLDTHEAGSVDHLLTVVSVSHGTLSVTTGGGATVTANGSGSVTISGSAAGVNAALEGMVYAPTADYNGADTLVIVTHDEGYNGIGGTLMASDAIAITVNPVNDAPTVALAVASVAVDEDDSLVFAAGNGNGIDVGDLLDTHEAGSVDHLLTVVSVSHGTLNVITGGGATVTANGSGSVTISGSAAGVNAALEGMIYAPTADYNGADTLVIVTHDEGYNGIGGTLMASDAIAITVNPVNDAPVITPTASSVVVNEDGTVSVPAITVTDAVDTSQAGATDALSTVVSVAHGTLAFAATGGASISTVNLSSFTLTGTAVQISTALSSLSYTPTADYHGSDTLTITTSDLGHTGGGVLSDVETIGITINPVNDAPTVALSVASVAVDEDNSLVFAAGNGNGMVVGDATDTGQAGSVDHLLTVVSVSHGTLSVTTGGGATVTANGSGSVTISGSAAGVNAALEGMVYAPTADYNGADTLVIVTHDEGYNGIGGTLMASDAIAITVNPVNDAPVITPTASSVVVNEDGTVSVPAITVTDAVDTSQAGATDALSTVVSVAHGTLAFAATGGASISTVNLSSFTLTGTAVQISTALSSLSYTPTADYHGSDTLTITTSDLGHTGGGVLSDVETMGITIHPVNDDPVAIDATLNLNEDVSVNGTLNGSDIDGDALTFALVTDGSRGHVTITNAATGAYIYSPYPNQNGSDSFTYSVGDGLSTVFATVTVGIAPVNDAPGANDDTLTTVINTGVSDTLSGTDTEGSALTFTIVDTPDHGTLTAFNPATGAYTYTPNSGYTGSDSFTFTTSDGALNSPVVGTISITVNAVNIAPVITLPPSQINLPTNTFDVSTALTGYFTQGTSATGSVTWSNTAGLSGGGGVAIAANTDQVWTLNSGIPVGVGNTYVLTAFVESGGNSGYGALGFTTASPSSSAGNYGAPAGSHVGVLFHGGGGGFLSNGAVDANGNATSNSQIITWNNGGISPSNAWYNVILTVTDLGSNHFYMKFEVYNADANGNIGSLVTQHSMTDVISDPLRAGVAVTNSAVATATTLYPFISNDGYRIIAVDNLGLSYWGQSTPNYTENGAPVTLHGTLSISDVDDVNLTGASVWISSGFTGGDSLNFSAPIGIAGAYNPSTGVLTFSGAASIADYMGALNSVTFSSTSENPTALSASRTISWQVTDTNSVGNGGILTSSVVTSQVSVTGVNDAPTAANQSLSMPINTDYTFNANSFGFSDVDNNTLASIRIVSGSGHLSYFDGSFWIQSPNNLVISSANLGNLHFNANVAGSETFTFRVSDGITESLSTYTMTTLVTQDVPANVNTSFQVALNGSVSDTLEVAGDQDWFIVHLTAGNIYQFNANGISLPDPYLWLLNSVGGVLVENDDANGVLNSQLSYTATYTGVHYLAVGGYGGTNTGSYNLLTTCISGDPLVLDLDGNGVRLTSAGDGVRFDMNQDGATETTGWISSGDGLLVLDADHDGRIQGIAELVSDQAVPGSGSSLNALASFDLNHDGRVDADDDAYSRLQVWRDLNHDGVSDTGELHGLAQLGIAALNLTPTGSAGIETQQGNTLTARTTFEWNDGSLGSMAEVGFRFVPNDGVQPVSSVDPWQLARQGVKTLLDDGAPHSVIPITTATTSADAANTLPWRSSDYHDMVLGDASQAGSLSPDAATLAGITSQPHDFVSSWALDSHHPPV
ncbi:hypothetical protein SIID45300_00782 [Candidatus Magnetaquicoccaceae bacterium FCR-1]|uniref:RapA2 cadherin-like domain-containing protein n=1 Tax=Candidatus Magnetaquiglobus chichijimensis TaxID=3141448 RepID=A0ABQ0C6F7_9PROT